MPDYTISLNKHSEIAYIQTHVKSRIAMGFFTTEKSLEDMLANQD